MNKVRLNQVTMNTIPLNRVGLLKRRSGGSSGSSTGGADDIVYEDYTTSSQIPFQIRNAKKDSISSLILHGGTDRDGSPSWSNPAPIICNTGELRFTILSDNLLEMNERNVVCGSYINNSGQVTSSAANCYFARFIAVKPNTSYTLSTSKSLNYANFMEYDANGDFIKRTLYGAGTSNPAGTATTHKMSDTTAFVLVGSNISGETLTYEVVSSIKWMFSEGSSEKPYEAYHADFVTDGEDVVYVENHTIAKGAEKLLGVRGIDDTHDVITGVVTRRNHIAYFDGTEEWSELSGSNRSFRLPFAALKKTPSFSGTVLSTHDGETSLFGDNSLAVYTTGSDITGLENFRKALALEYAKGRPFTIAYAVVDEDVEVENVEPQPMINPAGKFTIARTCLISYALTEVTVKVKENTYE